MAHLGSQCCHIWGDIATSEECLPNFACLNTIPHLLYSRSRWDLTWRQLLNATDWTATPQAGQDVGEALAATPLYRGAVACHGRGAFGFGASVQDTGPVKELRALLRKWAAAEGGKGRKEALAVQAFDLALSHCQA